MIHELIFKKANYLQRKEYLLVILLTFILTSLTLFMLRNTNLHEMWAFGDLDAFPVRTDVTKEWILYIWRRDGLGMINSPAFNYFLLMFISSAILGSTLAQKVLFISIFIISFLTTYFLLRAFDLAILPSIIGGLFYSINPVTISSFIGGCIGELMTYAIFPLFTLYTIKLFKSKNIKIMYISILGLLSLFIWNIYVAFWYSVIFLLPLILITTLNIGLNTRHIVARLLRLLLVALIIALVLSPSLITIFNISKNIIQRKVSVKVDAEYTYRDANILNIIRLAGNKGSAQSREFLDYNNLNSYTILGLLIALIALTSLALINTRIEKRSFREVLALSAGLSFIVSCSLIMYIKVNPGIVDLNPIFSSLRNPEKLQFPLSLSLAALLSYSIYRYSTMFKKRNLLRCLFTLALFIISIASIIFYNTPALDGTFGLYKVRNNNYIVDSKYFKLLNIMKTIDASYNRYRILFLPWEYPTNLRIKGIFPNFFGTALGAGLVGINVSLFKDIFNVIAWKGSNGNEILSFFNVKYVIVDKTFKSYNEIYEWYRRIRREYPFYVLYSHNSYWLLGDPKYFYDLFKYYPGLQKVYEDEDFIIFRNNHVKERIFLIKNLEEIRSLAVREVETKNLVANPSFENNLNGWTAWPRNLIRLVNDAVDGNTSVAMYGQKKWFTNIRQCFKVRENALYKFKFSIKAFNITDAHAKVTWHNSTKRIKEGEEFSVNYVNVYKMNITEGIWHTVSKTLLSPKNAKIACIQFLGSRLDSYERTLTLFDNISFCEIIPKAKGLPSDHIKIKTFREVNPALWEAEVNLTSPSILVFTEAFSPSWKAIILKDDEKIETLSPIPIAGLVNGYLINITGNIRVIIKYTPQDLYNIYLGVSFITIIVLLIHLLYSLCKRIIHKD